MLEYHIVRTEFDGAGQPCARLATTPSFDVLEHAEAMAEFDAVCAGETSGFDQDNEGWWAITTQGRLVTFRVEHRLPA